MIRNSYPNISDVRIYNINKISFVFKFPGVNDRINIIITSIKIRHASNKIHCNLLCYLPNYIGIIFISKLLRKLSEWVLHDIEIH